MKRYLITTADERTWKFDRPVLFLGEWCRLYHRKHIWQDMDAIVSPPYGSDKTQKDEDHAEVRTMEAQLFPKLCDVLNEYHVTQHNQRFWQIVLGHWFRRYVNVIFNRVRTLQRCFHSHQVSGTTTFSDEPYSLAPQDSYSAIWAFDDDRWNNTLYIHILNILGVNNFPIKIISSDKSKGFRWTTPAVDLPPKKQILWWGYKQTIKKITKFLSRENDALVINSYLPNKWEEIKLQLALGQEPNLRFTQNFLHEKKPDYNLRKKLTMLISSNTSDPLIDSLQTLVFDLIPLCYLEAFTALKETVKQLNWPEKPKFIFTSNNYDTDETFKLWTAQKIEIGCKYIIGQHGNNFGTHRYSNPTIEESTADKFLTWGWEDGLPQHTKAFIFKTSGRKQRHDLKGNLLLIEDLLAHQNFTWDVYAEFNLYFEEQKRFVEMLSSGIKNNLIIRLPRAHSLKKWADELRWRDFDKSLKIETGKKNIRNLIANSRLVIHSYDSTGILETFSNNIPTLAFWQKGFDHLRGNARPYYQMLVNAGIFHLTPESAAKKVNEVWKDIESWWVQRDVQEARQQFCYRFAKVSKKPIRELKRILNKASLK